MAHGDGVIVGADISQEWLLPWWWHHYSRHNHHPVVFVDLGLSLQKKEWCKEKGTLLPLRLYADFVLEKEEIDPQLVTQFERDFGTHFWSCRSAWFKKPFALLQTPFQRSIWIDLDCEIRGSIAPLFDFADTPQGIAMAQDDVVDYTIYNSGVIPYKQGNPLLIEWAENCRKKSGQFRGDQEVFSHIIAEKGLSLPLLPALYNWSRLYEEEPGIVILHWHGHHGKQVIRHQISTQLAGQL